MTHPSTGLVTSSATERRVVLRGRLTRPIASCCIARLLVLASDAPRESIVIYIDSPGGSPREALGVISTMNGIRCPVATFCHGQAAGPAAIIAAHGFKGFRVAAPGASFSLKLAETTAKAGSAHHGPLLPLLAEILATDSSQPQAQCLDWLQDGKLFTSKEALQHGLIDAISAQPLSPQPHS